jgi:alanyl aminopeptidase
MAVLKRLIPVVMASSVVAITARAAEELPKGRLGREVVPAAEAVSLTLDPTKPDYSGSVRVELVALKRTSHFSFFAQDLKLGRITLRNAAGALGFDTETKPGGMIEVTTRMPLAPGNYHLEIAFSNAFNTKATSLYRLETGGQAYVFTQFESADARQAFPCWDEPLFKIPWTITLTVPEADMAVANTPIERESRKHGLKTVLFKTTRALPSYLLAMAVGPLEAVPIPGLSIPGNVITVKGASGLAAEAVRVTPPILKALEFYFGRNYPYEKLDLIAVPEFWPGAMENPGAITFADRVLLVDPKGASVAQRRFLAVVTAHELSHMWFGDLVTLEWWDDLWLNESFASWMGDKVTDEVFPEYDVSIQSVQQTQRAMFTDALVSARAVRQQVASEANLDQLADELAYDKGRAVLEMIENWIGPKTFRKGVLLYLEDHKWGNANADDLWRALSTAAGFDLGAAMSTFLDQPGVPLLQVEITEDNRVRLTQRRFRNQGVESGSASLWNIPIQLKYSDGQQSRIASAVLTQAQEVLPLDARAPLLWLHPNAGEKGYYRWSAPAAMLETLAGRAGTVLEPRERVGFVGNLGALVRGGVVHGEAYLRLLTPLADDTQPEVVRATLSGLGSVKRAFASDELAEPFAAYVRRTLAPALARTGLAKTPGEPESTTDLRPLLLEWLGGDGRDPAARAQAKRLAEGWLRDPASVDPSIAGAALHVAAIEGDRAMFDEYRTRFEAAEIPADRSRFLLALGAFQEPSLVEAALAYALAGPLRPQEVFSIPRTVSAASAAGEERVYRWMTENYKAIVARVPATVAATQLPHFASGCSTERLAAAQTFFADPARQLPGTDVELVKIGETVKDCAALRARDGHAVAEYLRAAAPAE